MSTTQLYYINALLLFSLVPILPVMGVIKHVFKHHLDACCGNLVKMTNRLRKIEFKTINNSCAVSSIMNIVPPPLFFDG